jgi:uncharacterized protein YndB with AHSA1/START domain
MSSAEKKPAEDAAPSAKPALMLRRKLKAPPARVYEAWTDAAQLMQWFGPENVTMAEADCEVRVGGHFHVVMIENTGDRHEVNGVYKEVVRHEKLVFSWSWISTPERVSQVTVRFKEEGGGTLLTLIHEQLHDEAAKTGHTHGWTGSLDKLEKFVG